jgi:hypothetical protein
MTGMDDAIAIAAPQPRSHWRRWIISIATLAFTTGCFWLTPPGLPASRPASQLTIGMTKAEVDAVMRPIVAESIPAEGPGRDVSLYMGDYERGQLKRTQLLVRVCENIGLTWPESLRARSTDIAVLIWFDDSGRVRRVQRGGEIIEADTAS